MYRLAECEAADLLATCAGSEPFLKLLWVAVLAWDSGFRGFGLGSGLVLCLHSMHCLFLCRIPPAPAGLVAFAAGMGSLIFAQGAAPMVR